MDPTSNVDEFVRLYSTCAKGVYSYIHILVPNHADAEDLFQETSRTLWAKFAQYQASSDEGFRAWALRIAQLNVMHHHQRQSRRNTLFTDRVCQSLNGAALTAAAVIEPRFEALDDCYAKLPEEDRRLIDARYQAGATVEAIAAAAGQSVHAVYRALRRIHQSLFDCIRRVERREAEKGTGPICAEHLPGRSGKSDPSPFPPNPPPERNEFRSTRERLP